MGDIQPTTVADMSCGCREEDRCAMLGDAIHGYIEARALRCTRPAAPDDVYDCRWETRFVTIQAPYGRDHVAPWTVEQARWRRYANGWCRPPIAG